MAAVFNSACAPGATLSFRIDLETDADVFAREALLDAAMGADRCRKSSEKLRRGRLPADGLSFVARDGEGGVTGTVRLWHVEAGIGPDGRPVAALLLGPLAVDAGHEGRGIGGALMRAAISEAKRLGHRAILLVGDPGYYERFGFFADKAAHLVMPGPFERRRFLGLELADGALAGAAGMIVAAGVRSPPAV